MTPSRPIETFTGASGLQAPVGFPLQERRISPVAPETPTAPPLPRAFLPLLSPPRSLLERSSRFSGPVLSPASESVDRLVGQATEVLSRPSTAALFLGGGILFRSGIVGASLAEGRVLVQGISLSRSSALWRTGLALGGVLTVGCGSESSKSRPSEGLPEASPPPPYNHDGGRTDGPVSSPSPIFQSPQVHGSAPCGAGSMIPDIDVDAQGGLGVCANYTTGNHHLFRWDPSRTDSLQSIIPLPYPPDQVLRLSTGEIVISTHQNPGLSLVDETAGSESHAPFPTITTTGNSSSGRGLSSFQPRSPKGMVELNGQIYVAASNYDEVNEDYLPGTVLAYTPGTAHFDVIPTRAYNPTSVTPIQQGGRTRLLVVESGAINRQGQALTESRVEIFDPMTRTWGFSLPLGNVGAGISGDVAVSPDGGKVLLPTGNNSGDLLVVDLATQNIRTIRLRDQGISSDQVLLTNVQLSEDGRYAFAGNFNDGQIYAVDLDRPEQSPTPVRVDTNTLDGEGISDTLRLGRDLFVGMGPRVLRVGF